MHKVQEIIENATFKFNCYGTVITDPRVRYSEACNGKPKFTETEIIVNSWRPFGRVKFEDIERYWEKDTEDTHEVYFLARGKEYVICWRTK